MTTVLPHHFWPVSPELASSCILGPNVSDSHETGSGSETVQSKDGQIFIFVGIWLLREWSGSVINVEYVEVS